MRVVTELRCEECGTVMPDEAAHWKAELAVEAEDDTSSNVVTYCPSCWAREFGEPET